MAKRTFKVTASMYPGMADKVASREAMGDKERVGLTLGKTTGLPIQAYVNCLLNGNEKHKLTDDELAAMFAAEYPKKVGNNGMCPQPISAYRSYYNGQAHNQNPKGLHSDRYDENGEVASRKRSESNGKASGGKGKGGKGKPAKAKAKGGKAKASKSKPAAETAVG